MSVTFNADEIFEMAEEIERNGAKFYRKAAQNISDEQIRQMLLNMADMELGHLKTFQGMRAGLSDDEKDPMVFDPDNQAALYLQVMAKAHGYEGRVSPGQELAGDETAAEILGIALNSEKESVVFYAAMKNLIPPKAGRDKVEAIVTEELGHMTMLLNKLESL